MQMNYGELIVRGNFDKNGSWHGLSENVCIGVACCVHGGMQSGQK